MDQNHMRTLFDEDAKLYDEMRPGYPERLVHDILELSEVSKDANILEIGCGTGQATIPFAQRGFSMLCLDLGHNMIAIAQKKFNDFNNVKFLAISFEQWPAKEEKFDLVISGTAFHWIDQEIRLKKTAMVLKEGGSVAIFKNLHPDPPDTDIFRAIQDAYRKYVPEWKISPEQKVYRSSCEHEIQMMEEEINMSGLFHKSITRRYPWSVKYTSQEYIKLLNTYSDHRNLNECIKQKLFCEIAKAIDEFGGAITRPILAVLHFFKKSNRAEPGRVDFLKSTISSE